MPAELETEAKFPVSNLQILTDRLKAAGAGMVTSRHLERNWRFDDPSQSLRQSSKVLRVRQSQTSSLTFKQRTDQALTRREIELELPTAEVGVRLLEALGYQVVAVYEKYRQVMALDDCRIMLDELPFGEFAEIEGPSPASLKRGAAVLGLDWSRHSDESYLELAQRVAAAAGLDPAQITFEAYASFDQDAMALLGLRDALSVRADAG
jgi:adenylate cyclase class 2